MDPFYAVKDKVVAALSIVRVQFEAFNSGANTASSNIAVIKQSVNDIQIDVNDLADTISIVDTNRSKFPQISDAELASRQKFVSNTKQQLQSISKAINAPPPKQASAVNILSQQQQSNNSSNSNTRNALMAKKQTPGGPAHTGKQTPAGPSSSSSGNSDPLSGQRDQQMYAEQEQDLVLDDMMAALATLQNVGVDINTELKTQESMLTELDDEIDAAQSTMSRTLKKLDKLLASSDKGRLGCIGMLFAVALILLFVIIYT